MAAKPQERKIEDGASIGGLVDQMIKININSGDQEQVKETIPQWLENCESPFLWHSQVPRAYSSEHIIELCLEKLDELCLDETEFSLRRYTVLLKLVIEYSFIGNQEQVNESMKIIKGCVKRDAAAKSTQYEKLKLLLDHVVFATEAHLFSLNGQNEKSREIAGRIMPIDQMPNSSQAGLYAMKSNFILYSGYENAEDLAVQYARKALELEPDYPEWLFLLSKVLRQKRKENPFNVEVPREELVLLEKAVKQCNNSKYLQYLAQIYRECGAQAHKQHRNNPAYYRSSLFQTIGNMNEKALHYYKEALKMNPENPANLRRIGYGIMNLPKKIADYDLAEKCLLKSLNKCENTNTLHILGTFYHRYGNDNKKALEYYEKTTKNCCHAGLSDMIRVKFIENPEYDPCEDIEQGLKWETRKKHRLFLLTQQGGYFLFIKQDFLKSIKYFNQVILEDKHSTQITIYKCIFLRMYETINLYHYLVNEALLYLKQNNSSSNGNDDIYEVMALLETITNIQPELADMDPDPSLIAKLLEASKEIMEKEKRNKDRPHHYNLRTDLAHGYRGRGAGHQGRINRDRGNSFSKSEMGSDDEKKAFNGNSRNSDQPHTNFGQSRSEHFYSRRGNNQNSRDDEGKERNFNPRWRNRNYPGNRSGQNRSESSDGGRSQNYQNRSDENRSKADKDSNWRKKAVLDGQ